MSKIDQLMDAFCDHVPESDLKLIHNTDYYRLIDIAYECVMNHEARMDYDTFLGKVKERYGVDDEYLYSIKFRESLENLITALNYLKNEKKLN